MIIVLILGIIAFVVGFLTVVSKRFDAYLHRLMGNQKSSNIGVTSEQDRYFLRRYWGGIQGMIAGVGAICLYIFTDKNVFDALANWFHAIFNR